MGISKSEEFTVRDNRASTFAKALSHPARVAILRMLAAKNVCICGDIVELMPLSQSTVSQHLKELKDAGLIKGEIEGTSVCYCINQDGIKAAKECLNDLLDTAFKVSNDCC